LFLWHRFELDYLVLVAAAAVVVAAVVGEHGVLKYLDLI